jgi:hypothetical protein
MEFVPGMVKLTPEDREMNREYMSWSLGGGMVEAIFAGMRLEREAT